MTTAKKPVKVKAMTCWGIVRDGKLVPGFSAKTRRIAKQYADLWLGHAIRVRISPAPKKKGK